MNSGVQTQPHVDTTSSITWGHDSLRLELITSADEPVRIASLGGVSAQVNDCAGETLAGRSRFLPPMVEVLILGEGHMLSNTRFSNSGVGDRLRYRDHEIETTGDRHNLRVMQEDPHSGLVVTTVFQCWDGIPAARTWTEVVNPGGTDVVVQMVSSLATGALLGAGEDASEFDLVRGRSEWCGEGRWSFTALHGPDGLPDINTDLHDHGARGALITASKSTWSSGEYLPTGFLVNRVTGNALGWQIEHNGAWRWEVDSHRDGLNALALIVTGPNDLDHQWNELLSPGTMFTSVPVSFAATGSGGFEGALAGLTAHRRAIRRVSVPDSTQPVIYNDYMNTLMGDPTTQKLLPLIDAAAAAGAEYFCVDAGWYDDGGNWWPSVGEWKPSTVRFPDGGLKRVLDHIRSHGMKPGLWLEPEVVGIHSPLATQLPDEAFLQRFGRRVVDHDRYFLDLSHSAARAHLDSVVARLVEDLGSRYFKLDYNVTPGPGTDLNAFSVGSGLLRHNRGHLDWLDGLVARHPQVIFENCASGAMRLDYAMMSRLDLQSTSDQQDFRLYATIAAAAPASLLPEQAGNWAYPQPGMTEEELSFAMINGLVGRLYLSGRLDGMSGDEAALVAEGVRAFKSIRSHIASSTPFWPLGLPGWFDDTVALGLRSANSTYLAVWSRAENAIDIKIPLERPIDALDVVYPHKLDPWSWSTTDNALRLEPSAPGPTARLFRLTERS